MLKNTAKVFLLLVAMYTGAISGAPAGAGKELAKDGVPLPPCPPRTTCKAATEHGQTALLHGYCPADSLQIVEAPTLAAS